MKKVLIVLPSFGIGGTTVSTLNLIRLLSARGWHCSVLPLQDEGELSGLYSDIEKVTAPSLLNYISAPSYKSANSLFGKITAALVRFLSNRSELILNVLLRKVYSRIKGNQYSVIVAAQESLPSKIVARFPHPRKIAWVRCDYSSYLQRSHKDSESFYHLFNSIVCVSNQGVKSFLSVYPELTSKVHCIPNPQDSDYIRERADSKEVDSRFNCDLFTLVSVGRMDPVKRYTEIPRIAKNLLDRKIIFKWYLIGNGPEKQNILDEIDKWDVRDYVILLGVKQNPHYYIKNADLYVCLSSTESCPRVVNEAKILATPTVSTEFPSIYEFLENGITGWIGDLDSMPDLIAKIIKDKIAYQEVVRNIQSFQFDNTQLIKEIEVLFTSE